MTAKFRGVCEYVYNSNEIPFFWIYIRQPGWNNNGAPEIATNSHKVSLKQCSRMHFRLYYIETGSNDQNRNVIWNGMESFHFLYVFQQNLDFRYRSNF